MPDAPEDLELDRLLGTAKHCQTISSY